MPSVLYLAERGSDAFEAARHSVDVVCAGDSITGWNNFRRHEKDWPLCSYPESLQKLFEPIGLTVADCGIAGERSPDGVGRVREYLGLFPNARYFVLGYGANDIGECPGVEEASRRVVGELDRMVGAVRAAGRTAVLLGVPNPDESRLSREDAEILRRTLVYHNERLREYCRARRVPLVEVYGKLRAEHFDDPYHPNERGARIIAREVFRVLWEIQPGAAGSSAP